MNDDDGEIQLDPQPGLVVKTLIASGKRQGTKLFVNVCSDSRIPEPVDGYGQEIMHKVQSGEDYIVPIVLSRERDTVDKAGRQSVVYDCCMHPRVIVESIKHAWLRVLVIETCLELVEDRAEVVLSRDYATPKMVQKGELERTIIRKRDLEQGPHNDLGLTRGIDEFARSVLPTEQLLLGGDSSGGAEVNSLNTKPPTQTKQGPLIEVISSSSTQEQDDMNEGEDNNYESKETRRIMTYRIEPFEPVDSDSDSPRYEVVVDTPTTFALDVRLDSGAKVLSISDGASSAAIALPVQPVRIEAYGVRPTGQTHVFVY